MCSYLRISMLDGEMIIFPHISGVNQGDLLYNLFEHSQGTIPNMNSISLFLSSVFCLCLLSSRSYAKIHIPIIASVSEHQPTTWVSFFFDLHILVCTFPAGLWFCIKNINDERVFGRKILLSFLWNLLSLSFWGGFLSGFIVLLFQSKASSELKRFSPSSRRSLVHENSIRLIVVIPKWRQWLKQDSFKQHTCSEAF